MDTHWGRTLRTVRYLRPVQLIDRVVRNVRPFNSIPQPYGQYRLVSRPSQKPARRANKSVGDRRFSFLNHTKSFVGQDRWHPRDVSLLWIYNLNYFQYVWEMPNAEARSLMLDWIDVHQDPKAPAWHPYVLSLRIREWVEWLVAATELDDEDRHQIVTSLVSQVEALRQQIEFHLLGNHVLENAITLCWAGLSLMGPLSQEWIDTGFKILRNELGRQVLSDGTHDERSPMYQALIAEALLRLSRVANSATSPMASQVAAMSMDAGEKLFASLEYFVHPDGDYALVNDCALGIAPTYSDLASRFDLQGASDQKLGVWALPDAGYFGFRSSTGDYLIFDAGPLGPDHQPGHGHADCLSFEMSFNGRRIFTDSGVNTYEQGPDRDYHRGTSAHNTIVFNNRDQAELWEAFRCGRRPQIRNAQYDSKGNCFIGEYRGPHKETHRRKIELPGERFEVSDFVSRKGASRIQWCVHLAPGLDLVPMFNGWKVCDKGDVLAIILQYGFDSSPGDSKYFPEFGVEQVRKCLRADMQIRDMKSLQWGIQKGSKL